MKATLISYDTRTGEIIDRLPIAVDDDYDGDPYGDRVHIAVGSNQTIIVCE
jgi:hypothetical protein